MKTWNAEDVMPELPMRVDVVTGAGGEEFLSLRDARGLSYAASTCLEERPILEALALAVNRGCQ
jgi:hypothetical protein